MPNFTIKNTLERIHINELGQILRIENPQPLAQKKEEKKSEKPVVKQEAKPVEKKLKTIPAKMGNLISLIKDSLKNLPKKSNPTEEISNILKQQDDNKKRMEKLASRNEKLSQAPSEWSLGRIKQRVLNYFNEVPYLQGVIEAPIEKALKKDVIKEYPVTESFKSFTEKVYLQTDLPKEEPSLGLIKGKKPYGGVAKPRSHFQSLLATVTMSQRPRKAIEVTNVSSATVMHEMLHSWLDQHGLSRPWSEFNKDWEKYKPDYPFLQEIDQNLLNNPVYKESTKDEGFLTDERFAWLGEMFGEGGIKNIPFPFEKYYKKIFK
jgi:hypothetical protein